MRLATFNLESLDRQPQALHTLERRIDILRPQLERLAADILCVQEINAQHVTGKKERAFIALDQLLEGTRYAAYNRATSHRVEGSGAASVHNLVTLSRFPIVASRELKHELVPPLSYRYVTAQPPEALTEQILFDRPILLTELAVTPATTIAIINVHLRAPLAAAVKGQKLAPFTWATTSGWAEGFFVASLKRNAQALEIRLAIDQMLDADPHRLIAVAGDLNAEDGEVPLKLLLAAEGDTGNGDLEARSLILTERSIPEDRRFSVLHHGYAQMLDHILVSRGLLGHFKSVEVHNETLADEVVGATFVTHAAGSYHAPMVADFAIEGA